MAVEDTTNNGSTSASEGQEQQQAQQPPAAPAGQEQQASGTDTRLPDDHPLVAAYNRQKQANAELRTKAAEADQVPELKQKLTAAEANAAKVEPLQKQYSRLEAFLTALGGPVSQILDSRTFSTRLFESEDKIEDIIKDFHKANPSATSAALSSTSTPGGTGKVDPNVLLRAAVSDN
jgi:hypothetical protein